MADKISVSYDANIDDMKRKLDELIAKNKELSAYATAAAKALSNIASAQGLSTINNINNSFNTTVNVLAQVNTNLTQVNAQLNNTTNSFNRMGQQVNSVKQSITVFDSLLKRVAARVAAYFAIDSVVGFAKSIVDVERKMEILQNRINFVFDSATGGTLAFNRLREMSIRLGIEFTSLAEGFASFGIAAKMAGFSASESESMFGKVAVALRASGASSLQTQRSFYALQQMLSKGVVAAEELRRQLGEALPGASDLMTKAYNRLHPAQELTNRQFTKLLEDGKIISAEILPEFANVVEEVFAPALSGKQNSLDASINRVTTQLDRFKLALANFLPTKAVANTLSDFFGSLNTMMEAGFKDFVRLGALAASGNFAAFDAELAKLEIVRAAETAKAEREQKDIENRIKQRAELYAKQGVSTEKAISGETDRITEQRKELEELNKELERREIALKKARTANVGQPGTAGMSGMADVVGAKEALKQQKELVKQKEKEIEFTQGLITAIGQLSQKREEEQEKVSADTKKAEIAAAKELLAAEETRLVATTEGTTAYYNQLVKVIEARKNLAKIEQRDTPQAMGLSLAKLDKDLEKARKMVESFDPNVAEVIEEGIYVPSIQALERLDKENRAFVENQLQLNLLMAQRGVEITEEGTEARLIAERNLALEVAELEKFKVKISNDSEELKASKIKLINDKLRNEMKKLGLDYAKDQKEIQDKIVEDQQKTQDRIADIIQDANDLIERNEGDSFKRRLARSNQMFEAMVRKLKEEMSKTEDFQLLEALKKKLNEVEEAGKKAAAQLTMSEVADMVSKVGDIYGEIANRQSVLYENEQNNLKKMLDDKLISEEEYNRRTLELRKKQFNQEKQTAIIKAIIDGASAIMKSLLTPWQIPLILGMTAAQISTISAQQFPGFKEGVIDLQGSGTATSDSIPARLSRGESVMTAEETKQYRPVLQAIRDGEFEAFVAKRYIGAMQKQEGLFNAAGSFANNVSNSFDMQTAELATLLKQNRKVAIKNVDELAKAINRKSTAHKVIDRRTLR
jgi:tape measure domain-containing protein